MKVFRQNLISTNIFMWCMLQYIQEKSVIVYLLKKILRPITKSFLSFSPDSGELDPEMAQLANLGFTGCLSAVLFNSISPLKAALLHSDSSPVIITGSLVQSNCGSTSANTYAAETTDHLSGQRELLLFLCCYCHFLSIKDLSGIALFHRRQFDSLLTVGKVQVLLIFLKMALLC